MSAWTEDELQRVAEAEELRLAPLRSDGSLWPYTTMWVVRVGNGLYVRSAGGPHRPWYRHALSSGSGRIRAGGIEADVAFGAAPPDAAGAIDSAYHAKYDRYGPSIVGHVTGHSAHDVTVRLTKSEQPRGPS